MRPALPRLTAGQIIRVLEKVGFMLVRQSGSHRLLAQEPVVCLKPLSLSA